MHLHVISSDLCSPTLKHKKHYNSFHPKLGFFLHIDDVLSWFEGDSASFNKTVTTPYFWVVLNFVLRDVDPLLVPQVISLQQNERDPLLKNDLECWRCRGKFKTFPKLKEHLTQEKEGEASRKKKTLQTKKGKNPDGDADEANLEGGEPSPKR